MKKQYILLVIIFVMAPHIFHGNTKNPEPLSAGIKKSEINESTLISAEKVNMNATTLTRIDAIVKEGLNQMVYPGCQVLVMKNGKTVFDKSYGTYTYESDQKVKPSTMYDLASLSKTTGTLLAIMKLYDTGKLKLTDKASVYLSFLKGTDKANITIKDLLFHETGLPGSLLCYRLALEKNDPVSIATNTGSDNMHYIKPAGNTYKYKENYVSKIPAADYTLQVSDSFYLKRSFHDDAMQKLANTKLGSKNYLYSCVNFILLKEIAEVISGKQMNNFLADEFYNPMQLKNLTYLPLRTHTKNEIAPTLKKDFLRNGLLQGYVHDPDAAFLGGVSGNAGLFATSRDVAMVYQMLLNDGELNGIRYLSNETCQLFTTVTSASGRRGLGFDKPIPSNPKYSPCSASAPAVVYGHTGYTGTCCWVDPKNKLVYVFLSNRTYPNDGVNKLARLGIRTRIQDVIYQSLK